MKQLIKFSTALLLTTAVLFFSSCDSNEGVTSLDFPFPPKVGSEDFSFSKSFDINGVATQFATAQFYVHGIELEYENETKSIDEFLRFQNTILYKLSMLEKTIVSTASEALRTMIENGLEHTDFKSSWFPKFLLKIQEGEKLLKKIDPSNGNVYQEILNS